jgi:hypothetical protein
MGVHRKEQAVSKNAIISVQATRNGYVRYGRSWSIAPVLVEVCEFKRGARPKPSKGSGAAHVLSPREVVDLRAYVQTPNAQMAVHEPTAQEAEQAAASATVQEKRAEAADLERKIERLRLDFAAGATALADVVEKRAEMERAAAEAEQRRDAALAAAAEAEERAAQAEARATRTKGGGK